MKNLLTFDIEDWYHPNLADPDLLQKLEPEDRVEEPTLRILNMLDQTKNTATFFILGDVAEKFPKLVQEISRRGHEVASHGYRHNLVYDYTRVQFETDVARAVATLREITGQQVLGYRAPSWSLGKRTPWAWEVLHSLGFKYDSSLYPFATFLYGDNSSPRFAYDITVKEGVELREIPPSVAGIFGKRMPFSGGFYFRVAPYSYIKWGIRQCNRQGQPANMYLHPWELDVGQPRLKVSAVRRFLLYANIERTERKLLKLLREYSFVSIQEFFSFEEATSSCGDSLKNSSAIV